MYFNILMKTTAFLLFLFFAVLSGQSQTHIAINPVAQKYFSVEQVEKMSNNEIKAVNFLFTSSFIADTTTSVYKKWIKENGDIDIVLLKPQRKKSERTFYRHEKYPGFVIEFLSRDEVEAKINSILNTPKSKN